MRIVVTAATHMEWLPFFNSIFGLYTADDSAFKVQFHTSGVGIMATVFSLTKLLAEEKPDLIIQVGIAGCFDEKIRLGEVFLVSEDMAADVGVEENGEWRDVFDMKLENENAFPFTQKILMNSDADKLNLCGLQKVKGITVNEITTRKERIAQLKKKYNPCIESMEGAALHYTCLNYNVPFVQLRSVCNYIGERDKSKWTIKESLDNLSSTLTEYIDKLYSVK